ncbi:polynucleotide adenylyltransferase PcnB [Parendozoicomonas sp. Alg238-R29]|uniref:polynucleotide adenylyltransferase PcnB n=1 Tax=Parendozoicomonas sp. Alg238-R29 TaxID=2993446 RepID=UPI00248E39CE|nr:polynucleotide adenylyltransferase PcnB [Parendozoicomonas sp. Alg238-R29]
MSVSYASNRCLVHGSNQRSQHIMTGGRKGLIGFLSRLFSTDASSTPEPIRRAIPRDDHSISRKNISDNALKVLYRLRSQGHEAWLVGGCIRDLLLGLSPKDFDVATSAPPEVVRSLFRNSRIIGRRFKLIHVVFGREVIEVATFRASHDSVPDEKQHKDDSHHSDSGRILRDNVYGSIEDDAIRRDFTINALYYTTDDFSVHDFCGGMNDIENRQIRLIGDPVRRYHEDPVRMLRAIRFAAKLDFQIEESTAAPIRELGNLLRDIPSSRLFDETLKLFLSGYGQEILRLMREYELFEPLFPATESALFDNPQGERLLDEALKSTDRRIQQEKPVTPAFFYAAALWPPVVAMAADLEAQGLPPVPALHQAAMQVVSNQCTHTAIPKRFSIPMREIWDLQRRLERRQPRRVNELLTHPRFRAAYDFLLLREASGEDLGGAGQWWTDYQAAHPELRADTRQSHNHQHREQNESRGDDKAPNRNRRRRTRRRKPASNNASRSRQTNE